MSLRGSAASSCPYPLSERRETAEGVTPVSRRSCGRGGAQPKSRGLCLWPRHLWLQVRPRGQTANEAAPCCRAEAAAAAGPGLQGPGPPRLGTAPAVSRSPRCRSCVCSWLGRSRSPRHSRIRSGRVTVSDYSGVSPPSRPGSALRDEGVCLGLALPALARTLTACDALPFRRLDHRRGPPLPHPAPLLEPHPARRHQVGPSGRGAPRVSGRSPLRHPLCPSPRVRSACGRAPGPRSQGSARPG